MLTLQDAFQLGVHTFTLVYHHVQPQAFREGIKNRTSDLAERLGVDVNFVEICDLKGQLDAFLPIRDSISRDLSRKADRLSTCFELGVGICIAAFSRDVSLGKGSVRTDFEDAIRRFALKADVPWDLFDHFMDAAPNKEVTGQQFVDKVVPRTIERIERFLEKQSVPIVGKRVFIGHGRSRTWCDLKDFVQDRLHLPWDEFNREEPAGLTTAERLSCMLEEAGFALIVMTGEDQHSDGSVHARENVVHEAGLFQGRLGFRRAILLIEDGCEEFSNVHGLTQIRFPKGNILAKSEGIRRVLEREGIL